MFDMQKGRGACNVVCSMLEEYWQVAGLTL